MGWLDNLEEDLSKSGRQEPGGKHGTNNDQSNAIGKDVPNGPSGASISKVLKFSKDDFAKYKTNDGQNAHSKKSDIDNVDGCDAACEPIDAIELFADKVTIAGLPEAYKERIKGARIMFRIALILATTMIFFKTRAIVLQYKNQETSFNDQERINYRAPFPNVSICIPTYYRNYDLIEKWTIPKRWQERMKKFNLTTNDIRETLDIALLWGFSSREFKTPSFMLTGAVFRAAAEEAKKNGRTIWNMFWPSCSEMLSNCAFDGQPFDCCQAATIMPMTTTPCVQIEGHSMPNKSKDNNLDPLRLENIGLTFEISTNLLLSYFGWGSDDGYRIAVNELPADFTVPVAVPAGMDVFIVLAEPKQVEQKTECLPNENVPKLKYYKDYDSNGILCRTETFHDLAISQLGCTLPSFSYIPDKECLFEAWAIASLLASGGGEAFEDTQIVPAKASRVKRSSAAMETKDKETFASMDGVLSKDSPCKPLCSRWIYPVFSASYGSIRYRDKVEEKRQSNRSWSRVRIILPQSFSSHTEEPRLSWYVALCDIGGIMGVYAGFSIITYSQILAYGLYIIWRLLQNIWRKCFKKE